jgi:hypothetical protein
MNDRSPFGMEKLKLKIAALLILVPGLICLNSEALSAQPKLLFDREIPGVVVNRTGTNAGAEDPFDFGLEELFNAVEDNGNALIYPGLYNPNFPALCHTFKTQP